jgi:hypothetical protein
MDKAKERFCCYCGDSLGIIEDRHYDRNDVCGKPECFRGMAAMEREEREIAHEQLDRDMGW